MYIFLFKIIKNKELNNVIVNYEEENQYLLEDLNKIYGQIETLETII